jgi:hypothetical protein
MNNTSLAFLFLFFLVEHKFSLRTFCLSSRNVAFFNPFVTDSEVSLLVGGRNGFGLEVPVVIAL